MYKGKYLYTIKAKDIKNPLNTELAFYVDLFKLLNTIGKLQHCDIGKRVYETDGGHYQVENDEQLAKRLSLTG